MGYYMSQQDSDFRIRSKNVSSALKALRRSENGASLMGVNTLSDALQIYGFTVTSDENGDITDIYFEYDKLRGQEEMLGIIAPYVQDGSFLQMIGEDDSMWRWVFRDQKLETIFPKIIWE